MSWNKDLSEYDPEEGNEFQYFSQLLTSDVVPMPCLTATREVNLETGERIFTLALVSGDSKAWSPMNKETMAYIGRRLVQLAEEQGRFAHGVQ